MNAPEQAAALRAAQKLELAARHLCAAARQMEASEVPRYAAHHLAARGIC